MRLDNGRFSDIFECQSHCAALRRGELGPRSPRSELDTNGRGHICGHRNVMREGTMLMTINDLINELPLFSNCIEVTTAFLVITCNWLMTIPRLSRISVCGGCFVGPELEATQY